MMGSTSEDDKMKILSDQSTGRKENETAELATTANNQLSMGEDNSSTAPMPVLRKQSVIAPTGKRRESADFRKEKTRDEVRTVVDYVENGNNGKSRKQTQQPASTRTHTVEMHNLSQRGHRDRINESFKVLQELVPGCNKFDKLLLLDDAIEYMKMLKLQVKIMSLMKYMGPWMFPDSQSYLATMGFMGMGMNMGMASGVDISSVAENIAHVNQLRAHATHQQDPTFNLLNVQGSNMAQIPNLAYPYRRYVGVQHPHVSAQSQSMAEPGDTKEHKINKENPDG